MSNKALTRLTLSTIHINTRLSNSLRDSSAQSISLIYLYTIPLPMWLGDLFTHKKIPSKHTRDIILY